jgi:hypothetical protein
MTTPQAEFVAFFATTATSASASSATESICSKQRSRT